MFFSFADSYESGIDPAVKTSLYIIVPIFILFFIIGGSVYGCRYLHKRRMVSLMGQNDLEHFYHDDLRVTAAGDSTLKVIYII